MWSCCGADCIHFFYFCGDLLTENQYCDPGISQYSVRSGRRKEQVDYLTKLGVPTAIHYPVPLYRQGALKNSACSLEDFPVTERITSEILSLPMSAYLTEKQQDYIVNAVMGF